MAVPKGAACLTSPEGRAKWASPRKTLRPLVRLHSTLVYCKLNSKLSQKLNSKLSPMREFFQEHPFAATFSEYSRPPAVLPHTRDGASLCSRPPPRAHFRVHPPLIPYYPAILVHLLTAIVAGGFSVGPGEGGQLTHARFAVRPHPRQHYDSYQPKSASPRVPISVTIFTRSTVSITVFYHPLSLPSPRFFSPLPFCSRVGRHPRSDRSVPLVSKHSHAAQADSSTNLGASWTHRRSGFHGGRLLRDVRREEAQARH